MVGTILKHRYEVVEKIGEGNLFTVYRCEDKIENQSVAAKVLLPQYSSNRMFAERILVEAQAMVGVEHPGIVEVYDCGEEDGVYYVITEYVRGVDLKERIRRNAPFSLSTAVELGLAICDVLDFAHNRGFVHGDLRPGNVLVTPEGRIKLADFWVGNAVASSQSVRTSALMRSVHYMSPEVAEGSAATPGSDVYSLGIILFELLTGALPFDGDTPIAIALKHAREPVPSLRMLNPGIPKNLETSIVKALQKSPQDRVRSAKAMYGELKSVRESLQLSRPITWSQPTEKTTETVQEQIDLQDAGELEQAEPAILSALRRTLIAVVGIVFVLTSAMVIWALTTPAEVRVPNLLGKTLDEAQEIAVEQKFQIVIKSEQFNEDYPPGMIYYTNPAAGRSIKSGKTVHVWISKGSKFTNTPNTVKLSLEKAKEEIFDSGLSVGEVSQEYSDSVPAGNIIRQTPPPGTRQERHQPVNLVFSLGPEPKETLIPSEDYVRAGETRAFDVKFTVPPGRKDQTVQIIVQDDYGESIVYSDIVHPGDRVEQRAEGVGDKITIRIYIDDKLVSEERKWR